MTPGSVLQYGLLAGSLIACLGYQIGGRGPLVKKSLTGIYQEHRTGLPPMPLHARWLNWIGIFITLASIIYWIVTP
jgi:hypothetical protein